MMGDQLDTFVVQLVAPNTVLIDLDPSSQAPRHMHDVSVVWIELMIHAAERSWVQAIEVHTDDVCDEMFGIDAQHLAILIRESIDLGNTLLVHTMHHNGQSTSDAIAQCVILSCVADGRW